MWKNGAEVKIRSFGKKCGLYRMGGWGLWDSFLFHVREIAACRGGVKPRGCTLRGGEGTRRATGSGKKETSASKGKGRSRED